MNFFGLKQESERAAKIKKAARVFFLGSLAPIIAISAAAYFSGQTILQNQAMESLSVLNDAKSEQLSLFIEKLKIRTADWSSDGRIRRSVGLISSGEPLAGDLSLYLRDGKLPIDPSIALADILDLKGIVIASSDMSRLGKDESKERVSFSEASAASFGEVIFTPELVIEEDELAGVPMLHFAAPVISPETAKAAGALLLHIKNDELNNVLAIKDKKAPETYLVNREKTMITLSRFIPDAVLAQSVDTPPVRACLDHKKDYQGSHLDYRGEPVFGVSKCLPDSLGVIITEIDASEVFASINVFRNIAALAVAIILVLTLIYILWSGKALVPDAVTTTTTATTVIIIIALIIIGVASSFFFSNRIEAFVWRIKTDPIFDLTQAQAQRHIADAKYFIDWQSDAAQQKLKDFASEMKISLPSVVAVKIYNKEAILIWSDLAAFKEEIGKMHEVEDVRYALEKGQLTKSVEAEIRKQIGSFSVLEIYTPIFLEDKNVQVGVAEVYFETSDLIDFIRRMQFLIWILIGISIIVIYFLLTLAFRKQNRQIRGQAAEIKKYAKGLEQKISERTEALQSESGRLKNALMEIGNKNRTMEDNKLAITNLLEDALTEKDRVETLVVELNKFQLAVENSFEHVIITDPEGIILYANKSVEKNTGYSRDEIIGQRPSLWGKQMGREFYEAMWRTIKLEKKPYAGELKNQRKNGDIYEVDLQAFPILDRNGDIRFFVGIERDITERKKLDEARTNFISVASHQLRTPLTSIKWTAELLLGGDIGELQEEQKEYMKDLYTSTKRMVDLVDGLLNIARIESAELKIKSETIDLADAYGAVIKELEPLILQKRHSLSFGADKDFTQFKADVNLFHEVLKNLLSNSIKYTPDGGEIKTGASVSGEEVIISVNDNGLGIPKNQQSKIFQKFFRADNVVRMNTDGTGLGMYIVKSLVDLLGGRIWFESEENKGTTFYVALPLKGPQEHEGTKVLI